MSTDHPPSRTKQTRQRAGKAITAAAALADVSPTSWRLYEIDRESVTPEIRRRCDAALCRLGEIALRREAA